MAEWGGVLIGNGASIAVWDDFAYDSLFERARDPALKVTLSPDDLALFDKFNTKNFEQVLGALKFARSVLEVLGYSTEFIVARYQSIQTALFAAVHSVHVPWGTGSGFEEKLEAIRDYARSNHWVYSINYDLLLYWAMTAKNKGSGFADFFWQPDLSFDPGNVEPLPFATDWTRVVWLHGGIHLRRHFDGTNYKERVSPESAENLLDRFSTTTTSPTTPLLVSEGTAEDKYRAIQRSSYLDFGLRSLAAHNGGLVVFGSSLRAEDAHLVAAINEQPIAELAFSLRAGEAADVVQRKAELRNRFPRSNLFFFRADTHPLGASGLKVRRPNIFRRMIP